MFCTGFIQQFSNSIAPAYLYYSTVPISIISLILGFMILRFGDKKKSSTILFSLTIAFFFLFASNIVLWITVDANIQTFVWFLNQFVFLLLPLLSFFLFSEFIKKNETSSGFLKILILALTAIFIPTLLLGYNIDYFDLYNCTVVETNLIVIYQNAVLILSCLLMAYLTIKNVFSVTETKESKTKIVLLAVGLCFMLFSLFFTWNPLIFGYSDGMDQFGFIGAIVFLSIITYMVVKFKMFGMKLLATQALVWGLVILIGSQFFFIQSDTNKILTAITLVISAWLGLIIIRSVKKEIEAREIIEKQKKDLETANKKLEAFDVLKSKFLSLASHQLRNPITVIKSCISLFLEGEYGEVNELQKNTLNQIFQKAEDMNEDVEKYLTVAKIDQGGLQYNLAKLDMSDLVGKMAEGQKIIAQKKGLDLSFGTDGNSPYLVNGDKIQLKQVVQNLIDNAMKFTKEGWIKVNLSKDQTTKKIRLVVSDSGRGIKPEIIPTLFKEFSRGDGAQVDAGGSGIGIYAAKEIVEKGHGGKIWVESDGDGKGSAFIVELPEILLK